MKSKLKGQGIEMYILFPQPWPELARKQFETAEKYRSSSSMCSAFPASPRQHLWLSRIRSSYNKGLRSLKAHLGRRWRKFAEKHSGIPHCVSMPCAQSQESVKSEGENVVCCFVVEACRNDDGVSSIFGFSPEGQERTKMDLEVRRSKLRGMRGRKSLWEKMSSVRWWSKLWCSPELASDGQVTGVFALAEREHGWESWRRDEES